MSRRLQSSGLIPQLAQTVMPMKSYLGLFVVACLLTACGSVGPAYKLQPQESSPSDETLVYIYRPKTFVGILNFDVPFVSVDGHRLTRIRIGGYLSIPLKPGRHSIRTTESLFGRDTGNVRGQTDFEVKQGAQIYLRYTEKISNLAPIPVGNNVVVASSGTYRFEAVNEAEAQQDLADTERLELEPAGK